MLGELTRPLNNDKVVNARSVSLINRNVETNYNTESSLEAEIIQGSEEKIISVA